MRCVACGVVRGVSCVCRVLCGVLCRGLCCELGDVCAGAVLCVLYVLCIVVWCGSAWCVVCVVV